MAAPKDSRNQGGKVRFYRTAGTGPLIPTAGHTLTVQDAGALKGPYFRFLPT